LTACAITEPCALTTDVRDATCSFAPNAQRIAARKRRLTTEVRDATCSFDVDSRRKLLKYLNLMPNRANSYS
jgi:hypothetical protein